MTSNSSSEYKIIADKIVSPDEDIIIDITGGVYKGSIEEANRYVTISETNLAGFDSAQVIETKATNYSLTSADAGKLILNSAAITITVEGLAVGKQVDFLQNVAGQITFAAGAGMTLNSKGGNLLTLEQYSVAGVKCVAIDTYVLAGDLGA